MLLRALRSGRPKDLRQNWWGNPRTELLAGIVLALALIPEAISFSIIAGVDPRVGLLASFTMAVAIAFTGGRVLAAAVIFARRVAHFAEVTAVTDPDGGVVKILSTLLKPDIGNARVNGFDVTRRPPMCANPSASPGSSRPSTTSSVAGRTSSW